MGIQLNTATGGSVTINSTPTGLTMLGTGTNASLGYFDVGDDGNIRIGGGFRSGGVLPLGTDPTLFSGCIAIGDGAGATGGSATSCIFIGESSGGYLTAGSFDILIGSDAGVSPFGGYGAVGGHNILIGECAGGETSQGISNTMKYSVAIGWQGSLERSNGTTSGAPQGGGGSAGYFPRYGLFIGCTQATVPTANFEFIRAQQSKSPGGSGEIPGIVLNGFQLHGASSAMKFTTSAGAVLTAPPCIVTNTTANPVLNWIDVASELLLYSNTSATGALLPYTNDIHSNVGDCVWYLNQWVKWHIYNTSSFTQTLTINQPAITGGTCSIGNNVINYAVALSRAPSIGIPVTGTGIPANTVVIASTTTNVTLGTSAGVASNVTGTAIVSGTSVTYNEHVWAYTPASATIAANTAATIITQKVGTVAYSYYKSIRIA